MELFIFVRMGGNRDDIKVSLLADNNLGINVKPGCERRV